MLTYEQMNERIADLEAQGYEVCVMMRFPEHEEELRKASCRGCGKKVYTVNDHWGDFRECAKCEEETVRSMETYTEQVEMQRRWFSQEKLKQRFAVRTHGYRAKIYGRRFMPRPVRIARITARKANIHSIPFTPFGTPSEIPF